MLRHRIKYGTTLMETICVLAILGVIAATGTAIAFPSLVSKQRATVESSNLANSLRMARHQAITSQQPIAVRFQRQGAKVVSYTVGSLDGKQVSQQFIENDVLVSTDATSVIFKAGGKKLSGKTDDEVINKFCGLVEKAEAKKPQGKFGKLKIEVKRNGKTVKLTIPVRYYGPASKGGPAKCKKTAKIMADGLDFLRERQADTGNQKHVSNENHAVATASLCGLAWIGSGKKKYALLRFK